MKEWVNEKLQLIRSNETRSFAFPVCFWFWDIMIKPSLFVLAALSLLGLVVCLLDNEHGWFSAGSFRRRGSTMVYSVVITLLTACWLSCLRNLYQSRQAKRERINREEAQALRLQTKIVVSAYLGSIGAPLLEEELHVDDITMVTTAVFSSDDATIMKRFIEAQAESLRALDSALQTIDISSRFFFGRKSSKTTARVLPTLRRQVDMLLMGKLSHLQQLCTELFNEVTEGDLSSALLEASQFPKDAVVTLARLRDMTTVAKRLLSEMCRLVLCEGSTACLRQRTCLVDHGIQEAQRSTAYLEEMTKAATLSASDPSPKCCDKTAILVDDASNLRLALQSLHQQHSAIGEDNGATDDQLLQQWLTVSRLLKRLTDNVEDVLVDMDHTPPTNRQEPTQSSVSVLQSKGNLLELKNTGAAAPVMLYPPPVALPPAETLVYSDVAEVLEPRRRRHRQDCHYTSFKSQPSPFELVEELQSHIRMMALPEEREAAGTTKL